MAGHSLYWELQEFLKSFGMVRVTRKSGGKEVEVWVHPEEGLRFEWTGTRASEAEIQKAKKS